MTAAAFAVAAAVSLTASWLLVSRLERIGARLRLSEALLGMLAALAADGPEITSAVTAVAGHQQATGAGVALGSNVFNLAVLLGAGAVVAGGIGLHRRVVALGGAVAVWAAIVTLGVVAGAVPVAAGLVLSAVVLAAYVALLASEGRPTALTRRLPPRWQDWLAAAVAEEETELAEAIAPPAAARWPDLLTAAAMLAVVVGASVVMEHAAARLGSAHAVPQVVTGGLVLAAVTCLPNAVAGLYLAARGRGAAALSTSLNSATINVTAGLLLPGAVLGLGTDPGAATLLAAWYAGLTVAALALAARHAGLPRRAGARIVAAYGAFTVSVLARAYRWAGSGVTVAVLAAASAVALATGLRFAAGRSRGINDP